jgi:CheY-like chemotaxis protein/HPt (histidine-containing phosphotransfer) domain-containing protein
MVEGPPKDRFVMKFVVKDTGRGIPEESTDEVFDTFTQAGVPLDQLRSGTGLGLAICRQLVDLMGGTIHVDTTLGKGSAFIFTILLNRPDTGALPPCPEPLRERTPHPSITVLVAEDNPPNAAVTVHFLKEMGHRTLLATNGVEVLDLLTRHRVDLVLMDFRMPRMDGLEASRRIRQGIPGEKIPGEKMRNLPIIAMTAHAVASYRDKFMAIGINGFLIKPVGFDELWQAIDTTVFNQSAPPPSPRNETAPLFDIDKALYLMGGNQALAREVCSIFLDDTPGVVEKLNAAIGQENRENAYIAAHTLKGACARVGALACQELSEGLIDGIHGMPLENLEKKTDRINKIFKRTCSSIGQWIETPETPREKECPIEQNC